VPFLKAMQSHPFESQVDLANPRLSRITVFSQIGTRPVIGQIELGDRLQRVAIGKDVVKDLSNGPSPELHHLSRRDADPGRYRNNSRDSAT
jgi:hypothetical protein